VSSTEMLKIVIPVGFEPTRRYFGSRYIHCSQRKQVTRWVRGKKCLKP
jgi:hypothetical protein